MKQRQLFDRIETYEETIEGACECGRLVLKTLGSDVTNWKDEVRYHYPGDNTASNIFRCGTCLKPIRETFKERQQL
jgi:hypothetical protein